MLLFIQLDVKQHRINRILAIMYRSIFSSVFNPLILLIFLYLTLSNNFSLFIPLFTWHAMGYWPPIKSNSPALKFSPPQSSNFLLPSTPTGNKRHGDATLKHKLLIQHNSWQMKKQSEIWRNTINLIETLTYRLNINKWFKYEKGANLFSWSAL